MDGPKQSGAHGNQFILNQSIILSLVTMYWYYLYNIGVDKDDSTVKTHLCGHGQRQKQIR